MASRTARLNPGPLELDDEENDECRNEKITLSRG
jgi:hypothetical protein